MTTNETGSVGGADRVQERRLSSTEQAIAVELRRTDPHLAGLFERGLALADDIDAPGVPYLVAHVGRELSRAVVGMLTGENEIQGAASGDTGEREDFRRKIASVLELPDDHPNVTAWFRSHQALVRAAHWRSAPPSAVAVRAAFVTFAGLLFGRIGPYFDTQVELDQLLEMDGIPSENDLARLKRCTGRYTQRRYFFSRLSNARWLVPLAKAGFFRSPPDRLMHEDGSWSIRQWPEGEALARLAADAPDVTVSAFDAVSTDNQNPAVWNAIAKAALILAPGDASRLVPALVRGLKGAPPVMFPRVVIDVIARLAEAGDHAAAFKLTDVLLVVKEKPPASTSAVLAETE